ncbi:uncharacterized protein EAF01_002280 [Botrytis porri]|uniref:uncharacterized protein n=1 Tax=Botrytis porri TaxID=87229 RepID=UPI00190170DC|nr:uncharacterized protein EAF01_002280 [Botrytis porri]KAF7910771.1 hypothetical protein EAF01_002280 [Botrytis porri]
MNLYPRTYAYLQTDFQASQIVIQTDGLTTYNRICGVFRNETTGTNTRVYAKSPSAPLAHTWLRLPVMNNGHLDPPFWSSLTVSIKL